MKRSDSSMSSRIDVIDDTTERLRGIFTELSEDPIVVGAIIADCLAIWLAGYHIPGDDGKTYELRSSLLGDLITLVWELIAMHAKYIGTPQ